MRELRQNILHYTHLIYAKGWVANHDGNLTARHSGSRILATPTAMSKGDIKDGDLIVVDTKGKKVSGRRRSFSEMALHIAIYNARPDIKAVVHAHPPYASALSVAGKGLDRPFMPEAVVSLGASVPLVPFAMPKTGRWSQSVAEMAVFHDALLLENHGVIAYGDTLEQAFLRLELVEHLATIFHHSMAFGGPQYLDDAHIKPLLEARTRAGLGPVARGVSAAPVSSHQPPTESPKPGAGGMSDREQLTAIITDELRKLLS